MAADGGQCGEGLWVDRRGAVLLGPGAPVGLALFARQREVGGVEGGVEGGVAEMLALPGGIVLAGLVMAACAKYLRRSPYFATGRGTDADALTLPMDRTTV